MTKLRLAVVGAGAAGLAAAKYAKERGLECVVYEQWSDVGGVWVYTDYLKFDEYGYPILTPMYKGLVTNLPKEIMGYSDFPVPEEEESYVSSEKILKFLNLYANHFDLKRMIKFSTLVISVKALDGNKWSVEVENKETKQREINIFDAIMICSGQNNCPNIPDIPGMDTFKGHQIHSKAYRDAEKYKDKVVLVIGGGISGADITDQLSKTARKVIFCYRKLIRQQYYPESVITKEGEVVEINESSVTFNDGTKMDVDCIIYTTGYKYSFPFLDESCGITVGEYVYPLYKHVININKPTMGFLVIAYYTCPYVSYELQARFFIHNLLGIAKSCSREEMMEDLHLEMKTKFPDGHVGKELHKVHENQRKFSEELARLGNTYGIPQVLIDIYDDCTYRFFNTTDDYKKNRIKIIDDKTFEIY